KSTSGRSPSSNGSASGRTSASPRGSNMRLGSPSGIRRRPPKTGSSASSPTPTSVSPSTDPARGVSDKIGIGAKSAERDPDHPDQEQKSPMTDKSVIHMHDRDRSPALPRGRLVFVVDATASREPTWAIAKEL